jgi:hypothetical protein
MTPKELKTFGYELYDGVTDDGAEVIYWWETYNRRGNPQLSEDAAWEDAYADLLLVEYD